MISQTIGKREQSDLTHNTTNIVVEREQTTLSQTSFRPISINSLMISMILIVSESPKEDLSMNIKYISRQSILAELSGNQ